jgi:hypothetical protein
LLVAGWVVAGLFKKLVAGGAVVVVGWVVAGLFVAGGEVVVDG